MKTGHRVRPGRPPKRHVIKSRPKSLHKFNEHCVCEVCKGKEDSLPTECPGVQMPIVLQRRIVNQELDYRWGRWWIAMGNREKNPKMKYGAQH